MNRTPLNIPASSSDTDATFSVKAFNTSNGKVPASMFFDPLLPDQKDFHIPVFCFLLTHSKTGKKYMFDLGVRKDTQNLAPVIRKLYDNGTLVFPVEKDITELLGEAGVEFGSVSQVIWSHAHSDHIGDVSKFPPSVDLVVGEETIFKTYPTDTNGTLLDSDIANRNVVKVPFESSDLTIGGCKAVDYLRDGSLYLLDAPGHKPGNLFALVRTASSSSPGAKDSFVLLAGDTSHHPGLFRPTASLLSAYPPPSSIVEVAKNTIDANYFPPSKRPFDITSRSTPVFRVPLKDSTHDDPVKAQESLDKLQTFDQDDRVLVVLAHDKALLSIKHEWQQGMELGTWREDGVKEKILWKFLEKEWGGDMFTMDPGQSSNL